MLETLKFFGNLFYFNYFTDSSPQLSEKDYPDLTGQKWMVSGATGGIGLEICRILIKQNAELWLVGRNTEKLESAKAELAKLSPTSAQLHLTVIDYNDLTTIKPAVNKVKKETNHLNGVIHCAGVMLLPKGSKTKQDFEMTVGVNNLATQLLQDQLDPLVVNTPNARIVWLSSMAMLASPPNGFDAKALANGSTFTAYAISKAMDYIQAIQWSKRHPQASSVLSLAVHPGVIRSDLTRHLKTYEYKLLDMLVYYDTKYGALPPINAALSPKAKNNQYYVPFGRPGPVRPDIYEAARNEHGAAAMEWIVTRIEPYQ